MCDINFNSKSKRNSGYKVVVVDKDNNVYSIFTGQQYKPGMVEKPPVKAKPPCDYWNPQLKTRPLRQCSFFKKDYVGFTSVFTNKRNAWSLYYSVDYSSIKNKYEIKLAKFTFTGDTFNGKYSRSIFSATDDKVIAGNNIESIEILN